MASRRLAQQLDIWTPLSYPDPGNFIVSRMHWPQFVVSGMLLWALNPGNPYGYYTVLRWVCCSAFCFLTWLAFQRRQQGWAWVLGTIAAIYNPLVPVHLTREIWSVINVVIVGIAMASIFAIKWSIEDYDTPRAEVS
jgi:hypothetical protein